MHGHPSWVRSHDAHVDEPCEWEDRGVSRGIIYYLQCCLLGLIDIGFYQGGYNLDSISKSALAVTKVLMGEPPGKLHDGDKVRESAMKDVETCVRQQARYWRCMRPHEAGILQNIFVPYAPSRVFLIVVEYGEKKGEYRLHGESSNLQSPDPILKQWSGKTLSALISQKYYLKGIK